MAAFDRGEQFRMPWQGEIVCGHNPWPWARRVTGLRVGDGAPSAAITVRVFTLVSTMAPGTVGDRYVDSSDRALSPAASMAR